MGWWRSIECREVEHGYEIATATAKQETAATAKIIRGEQLLMCDATRKGGIQLLPLKLLTCTHTHTHTHIADVAADFSDVPILHVYLSINI